jgi:DNA-binding LacI/PurR family transcriptional regulator
MATIKDVAREAGVGLGTASRALNGSPDVSPSTRARVLAAAAALGYQRSAIARAFSRRRTNTLEILIPSFRHYLMMEILRGMEAALEPTGYSIVIRTIEQLAERDRVFAACCTRGRADGVLLIGITPTEELVERLTGDAFPIVLLEAAHPLLSSVTADHEAAMAGAVRHCIELGHRRIALVDRYDDPFTPQQPGRRQGGYRQELAAAGLELLPGYEQVTEFTPDAAAAALDTLLSLPVPPTAILSGSDLQALGLLDAARRRSLRVPEDLSIVGYTDIDLARYLGLTTVRVPMREIGRQGMQMLLTALDQPEDSPTRVQLASELVVRGTCGPPPG